MSELPVFRAPTSPFGGDQGGEQNCGKWMNYKREGIPEMTGVRGAGPKAAILPDVDHN